MKRIPEPELMNELEQVRAYADADFAASDDAFVATFLARFGAEFAGPVVDLGCGPGNIAIRLARALPNTEVVGVDGSESMLAAGRQRAPDLPNLRFLHALIPSAEVFALKAAAIVSNSLLHHLHEPAQLWHTVRAISCPGVPVLVGDLRRPANVSAVKALVAQYTSNDPGVLKADFLASLHAAFEPAEIEAQLRDAGLDSFTVTPTGDRHVLVFGRVPAR